MSIKFLGTMIVALQLSATAYGISYKRLEHEADTYQHRALSKTPSDQEMVKKSLSFMSKEDLFDPKYTQSESFLKFYKETNDELKHDGFLSFSDTCMSVFEMSDDLHKAAVYMLLERVKKIIADKVKLFKRMETLKQQHGDNFSKREADESLTYFLNIDVVKVE